MQMGEHLLHLPLLLLLLLLLTPHGNFLHLTQASRLLPRDERRRCRAYAAVGRGLLSLLQHSRVLASAVGLEPPKPLPLLGGSYC